MPEISIIVPCYNATGFLPEAVASVLSQSLADFELLLVDDCSDDNGGTYKMISEFASTDPRIHALQTPENMGPGRTRNYGLSKAQGTYITFLDADDAFHSSMLAELHTLACKYNADVVKCGYDSVSCMRKDADGAIKGTVRCFREKKELTHLARLTFGPMPDECSEDYGSHGSVWAMLMKHSLIRDNYLKFPEEPHLLAEDFAFCYEVLSKATSYVTTTSPLYHYRVNNDSRSRKPTPDIIARFAHSADYFLKLIKKHHHEDSDRVNVESFAIGMIRGALKREFMAPGSLREKKEWFIKQQDYPIMRMAYEEYPWQRLPLKHKLGFKLFYKRKFLPLYLLIVGQEKLRTLIGK